MVAGAGTRRRVSAEVLGASGGLWLYAGASCCSASVIQ
jgi:hypothetical protein